MPNSPNAEDGLSPSFRRELIRLANREHATADDMLDLLFMAEYGTHLFGYTEPYEVIRDWLESFDEEP